MSIMQSANAAFSLLLSISLLLTLVCSHPSLYENEEGGGEMEKRLKIPMMSRLRNGPQQLHGGFGMSAVKKLKIPFFALKNPNDPRYAAGLQLKRQLASSYLQPDESHSAMY
ncbi:uncharacterized protein LOC134854401 [Symsagittifera roscoffensis]|uniref:uncharacterized protein LOC134854401 n=1 Tax=Symsagittifera roscoffensis TaxID=84072 RepID=UPI00307B3651